MSFQMWRMVTNLKNACAEKKRENNEHYFKKMEF
jgi:hypothetical protein